jgi:hypothetical protein
MDLSLSHLQYTNTASISCARVALFDNRSDYQLICLVCSIQHSVHKVLSRSSNMTSSVSVYLLQRTEFVMPFPEPVWHGVLNSRAFNNGSRNVMAAVRFCSAQNYWVFGLRPTSGILETRKHNVSETRSVSVLRWGGRHLLCWVP